MYGKLMESMSSSEAGKHDQTDNMLWGGAPVIGDTTKEGARGVIGPCEADLQRSSTFHLHCLIEGMGLPKYGSGAMIGDKYISDTGASIVVSYPRVTETGSIVLYPQVRNRAMASTVTLRVARVLRRSMAWSPIEESIKQKLTKTIITIRAEPMRRRESANVVAD
jgi:hypothetical protein